MAPHNQKNQSKGTNEASRVRRERLQRKKETQNQLQAQEMKNNVNEKAKLTLAIAGPNPLKSAEGPSALTVLTAQSTKPLYVPSGAP